MVGVPGRSKGCNTCRKRKKGCDLARPACGQCRKSAIECAGYDRPRTFVNFTNTGASSDRDPDTAVIRRDDQNLTANATIALPGSLARGAYEVRYLELFWGAYMPTTRDLGVHLTYVNPSWADAANELYPADDTLRTAMLSLGLATLGRRDGQRWMINEGLGCYVRSLRQMSDRLRQPHGWRSDSLLAASKALGLYELLYGADDRSSQAKNWQSHNKGEQALILQRSPEMYTQGHARLLFISARMHIIIHCIIKRQRCPLSTLQWKRIPFTNTPKTHKDALLDILADIPSLLEDMDTLRQIQYLDSPSHHDKRLVMMQECWRLDSELTRWFNMYGPQTQLDELRERKFRNDDLLLSDFVVAHIMGIYWAACILVYSTLQSVSMLHNGDGEVALPERAELMQYCQHVAYIAEVLLHPSAGVFGMHSAPLPVGVALMCVNSMEQSSGSTSPEKRRLLDLFNMNQGRGNDLGKFLASAMKDVDRL
ncbi:hypothetical protein B0H67DRAFT_582470 [Lasiosphaeris hirsuta]|uniref:Zn(2)-C6 fungal-type domain-containing protein n=1 Tax=Lasiosphaeris hirsuta TaxID=260670 RepID=A0AA40AHY4_9PEZI|nr:hypothetical protein B0H67DRAFT_582470 [Lasiosphaeris hirsuta]